MFFVDFRRLSKYKRCWFFLASGVAGGIPKMCVVNERNIVYILVHSDFYVPWIDVRQDGKRKRVGIEDDMVDELESVEKQSDKASTYFGVVVGVVFFCFFCTQCLCKCNFCCVTVWFCFVFLFGFNSVLLFGKQVVDISIRIG